MKKIEKGREFNKYEGENRRNIGIKYRKHHGYCFRKQGIEF